MPEVDPIEFTIKTTDASVEKYVKGRHDPKIVLNHLENFSSLVTKGGTILDLGCGHGRDCKYFEDKDFNVVGIDLSNEMLKKAKNVCKKSLILNMDIRDISKVPWKFDGVWCCAVLHHIPKEYIDNLLLSIHRIVNDSGVVFLTYKIDSKGYLYRNDLGVSKYYELHDVDDVVKKLESLHFSIINKFIEKKEYKWINIYARKVG